MLNTGDQPVLQVPYLSWLTLRRRDQASCASASPGIDEGDKVVLHHKLRAQTSDAILVVETSVAVTVYPSIPLVHTSASRAVSMPGPAKCISRDLKAFLMMADTAIQLFEETPKCMERQPLNNSPYPLPTAAVDSLVSDGLQVMRELHIPVPHQSLYLEFGLKAKAAMLPASGRSQILQGRTAPWDSDVGAQPAYRCSRTDYS